MPKGLNKFSPAISAVFMIGLLLFIPGITFSQNREQKADLKLEGSEYNNFVEISSKRGAIFADQELNMESVIRSIPESEKNLYPLGSPLKAKNGRTTLPWGVKKDPFSGNEYFHTAMDLAGPNSVAGKTIITTGKGEVVSVGWQKDGYGHYVVVHHIDGFYTIYAHLNSTSVKEGDQLDSGDVIGKMGATGRAKGLHLHYGVFYASNQDNLLKRINNQKSVAAYSLNPVHFLPDTFLTYNCEDYSSKDYKITIDGDKLLFTKIK